MVDGRNESRASSNRRLRRWLIGAAAGVVGLLVLASAGAWIVWGPNTPAYEDPRSVKVYPEASLSAVVDSLDAAGILRSRTTFRWMAELTGWGDQIKSGHYTFEAGASNYDLLDGLRRGLQAPVRLTIPPGSRPEVVAAVMAREVGWPKEDFLAVLSDSALAADLGTDRRHLFGYMLPETYFLYWRTRPENVVRKIKDEFDAYYARLRGNQTPPLDLNPEQVLTLASIVEWESSYEPERPTIAGVYLNRLRRRWPLQADPTIQYALLQIEGKKRRLYFKDYDLDHPYNTYQFRGLPPGPITNPSPSSIRAVLRPEDHDYFFFVANADGHHTFSRTLREHNRAAQAYYQALRERNQ